jgi:peptidyl-prolyl cis-trans isomerase A (cyclophilin A)
MRPATPTALFATGLCLAIVLAGSPEPARAQTTSEAAKPTSPALLDPSLARERAPDSYRVKLATTAGDILIEVHRDWAPRGADRFYNLVRIGYYNDVAFFRVIPGFMAQAGMHADPALSQTWLNARIPDDPVLQSNTRGRVTFAMSSEPGSRSVQFFINTGNNAYLDESGFAPFGEVVEGFEVVTALYGGYGEGEPNGKGPSQAKLYRRGKPYLEAEFPKLDAIITATVVE